MFVGSRASLACSTTKSNGFHGARKRLNSAEEKATWSMSKHENIILVWFSSSNTILSLSCEHGLGGGCTTAVQNERTFRMRTENSPPNTRKSCEPLSEENQTALNGEKIKVLSTHAEAVPFI